MPIKAVPDTCPKVGRAVTTALAVAIRGVRKTAGSRSVSTAAGGVHFGQLTTGDVPVRTVELSSSGQTWVTSNRHSPPPWQAADLANPWLIPVRLDDCNTPDLGIGGDRTLASIQRADLFGNHRDAGIARLLGEPLDRSAVKSITATANYSTMMSPLSVSCSNSKVLDVDVPSGRYLLSWSAEGSGHLFRASDESERGGKGTDFIPLAWNCRLRRGAPVPSPKLGLLPLQTGHLALPRPDAHLRRIRM